MTTRDYRALAHRVAAAIRPPATYRVFGQQAGQDGAERYDLLLVQVPAAKRPARYHVLLNGGTHGDEPAGAEAVTRFLEERRFERWPDVQFTVLPCTNPWGYAHDKREGPGGRDLNRSFRRAGRVTPEVSLLKRALSRQRFDMFLDCHEDVDAPGLYVFAPRALGRAIVAAAGRIGPIHPGPDVDGEIPLEDGIVVLDGERFRRRPSMTTWPLPFYVARYHRRASEGAPAISDADTAAATAEDLALRERLANIHNATIETPTCLPLDRRVAMHLAALDAALQMLHGQK